LVCGSTADRIDGGSIRTCFAPPGIPTVSSLLGFQPRYYRTPDQFGQGRPTLFAQLPEGFPFRLAKINNGPNPSHDVNSMR
jgi:hypothetical protein